MSLNEKLLIKTVRKYCHLYYYDSSNKFYHDTGQKENDQEDIKYLEVSNSKC